MKENTVGQHNNRAVRGHAECPSWRLKNYSSISTFFHRFEVQAASITKKDMCLCGRRFLRQTHMTQLRKIHGQYTCVRSWWNCERLGWTGLKSWKLENLRCGSITVFRSLVCSLFPLTKIGKITQDTQTIFWKYFFILA